MPESQHTVGRRAFLKAAPGGTLAVAASSYSRINGANERISAGLIGSGTRGVGAILPGAALQPDCQVVAICDVFKPNLDKGLSFVQGNSGPAPAGYGDYRRIIERKDIDVVFVATPDHWHSPITVAACEAGKDVYVEKPLANSIEDCQKVVAAAGRYQRVVQVGLQQRSMKVFADGRQIVADGKLGRVRRGMIVWSSEVGGPRVGRPQMESSNTVPDGLDWEMFQGPAPRRPYQTSRQRSWRSYWEYGSGAMTDLAVHMIDVMHWYTGTDQMCLAQGTGIHSPRRPAEQVPDIVDLVWKYDDFLMTYSSRPDEWGLYVYGDQGVLQVNRSVLRVKPIGQSSVQSLDVKAAGDTVAAGVALHLRNFLDCVGSRQKPACDAETGFNSTRPGLLAAMSVRTGKGYGWDGKSVQVV
jgi:predicted dehydrogenase